MLDEVKDAAKDESKETPEIETASAEPVSVLKDADAQTDMHRMATILARLEAIEKRLTEQVDIKLPEELVMLADCVREETKRDIVPAKKRSWFYRELTHLKDEDE